MQVHFTSDIHMSHRNIIKYCARPFTSVEEMNESLIQRWNDHVKPEDIVWSCGDFAFAKLDKIIDFISKLNGSLHMVTGNHDHEIIKNREILLSTGLVKEILPYKELRIRGQDIVLFHYGARVWNSSHKGSWLLYGHSHGSLEPLGKSVDVGMDANYVLGKKVYRPYSFDEIKNFLNARAIHKADKHE